MFCQHPCQHTSHINAYKHKVKVAWVHKKKALLTGSEVNKPKEEAAGPTGGVQPGLPQDTGKGIEGPEPLMGAKRLDKLEAGDLVSGSIVVTFLFSKPARLQDVHWLDYAYLMCSIMSWQISGSAFSLCRVDRSWQNMAVAQFGSFRIWQ